MTTLYYSDRGCEAYARTLAVQERLVAQVAAAQDEQAHLLLVEHDPPAITLGRRAEEAHVLASPQRLSQAGIELHRISRGGDVTYHGPGQLVAYPILRIDLRTGGVREYLRMLEAAILLVLERLGIQGRREDGLTGVWVGDEKVAAIGVAVRRWVSYHGLALNVCPDLGHFGLIVPCGISDKKVTSLQRILGRDVCVSQVKPLLIESLTEVFGFENVQPETLQDPPDG